MQEVNSWCVNEKQMPAMWDAAVGNLISVSGLTNHPHFLGGPADMPEGREAPRMSSKKLISCCEGQFHLARGGALDAQSVPVSERAWEQRGEGRGQIRQTCTSALVEQRAGHRKTRGIKRTDHKEEMERLLRTSVMYVDDRGHRSHAPADGDCDRDRAHAQGFIGQTLCSDNTRRMTMS
jgi:hypothetical protein